MVYAYKKAPSEGLLFFRYSLFLGELLFSGCLGFYLFGSFESFNVVKGRNP